MRRYDAPLGAREEGAVRSLPLRINSMWEGGFIPLILSLGFGSDLQ